MFPQSPLPDFDIGVQVDKSISVLPNATTNKRKRVTLGKRKLDPIKTTVDLKHVDNTIKIIKDNRHLISNFHQDITKPLTE